MLYCYFVISSFLPHLARPTGWKAAHVDMDMGTSDSALPSPLLRTVNLA